MGRRRQSVAEDLMAQVARLPWWGGLLLALLSWLVLRQLATPPASAELVSHEGVAVGLFYRTLLSNVAGAVQFVVPSLFCLAAVVSFAHRRRGRKHAPR